MKIKVLYSITALLILTLSVVVFAYTGNPTSIKTDSCCAMKDCCKDGKCKMGGECCKDKDSCPMMNKDSKEMSSMNHEDCCKDGKCQMDCCKDGKCTMGCCKDGKCDMQAHKKDGEATAMKGDCCKGKDSCPMMNKGENKDKTKTN
ncbi:MAG: hypothetical protein K1X72_22800 [Pyrinomonadaceae bacterium]|nr:hypothetical protein [Pyrinomonadaceae bacterium]